MSQADSFYAEKTCLSHMYNTSVCNQHVEQVDTNQVSSSYSCYSKLKFHFLMLKNKNVHLLYVLLNTECFI